MQCEFSLIKFCFCSQNVFQSAFVSKSAVIVTNMMLALNWWENGQSTCSLYSDRKLVWVFRFCLKSTKNFYSCFSLCVARSLLNLLSLPLIIVTVFISASVLCLLSSLRGSRHSKFRKPNWKSWYTLSSEPLGNPGEPRRCRHRPVWIQGSNIKCYAEINVGSICPN